jgi:hypothetical protein
MRKFTWLSVFAAGVALLFISGSFFPCLAVDACYKTKDGKDFHILAKPGDKCKKDETLIQLSGGGGGGIDTSKIYEAFCSLEEICGCDNCGIGSGYDCEPFQAWTGYTNDGTKVKATCENSGTSGYCTCSCLPNDLLLTGGVECQTTGTGRIDVLQFEYPSGYPYPLTWQGRCVSPTGTFPAPQQIVIYCYPQS